MAQPLTQKQGELIIRRLGRLERQLEILLEAHSRSGGTKSLDEFITAGKKQGKSMTEILKEWNKLLVEQKDN